MDVQVAAKYRLDKLHGAIACGFVHTVDSDGRQQAKPDSQYAGRRIVNDADRILPGERFRGRVP